MGLADQLAEELAGLLAGAHPLRGPHGLVRQHRHGLGEQPLRVHPAVEQLLDTGHGHDSRPCLVRLEYVLRITGARGTRLGDLGLQLVEPRVHRTELLMVQPGEVVDLDTEGLHGDLELDQRLLSRSHGPLKPCLGPGVLILAPAPAPALIGPNLALPHGLLLVLPGGPGPGLLLGPGSARIPAVGRTPVLGADLVPGGFLGAGGGVRALRVRDAAAVAGGGLGRLALRGTGGFPVPPKVGSDWL